MSKSTKRATSAMREVELMKVNSGDNRWEFQLSKLPKLPANEQDSEGERIWVKCIKITHQSIVFSIDKQGTNRILASESNENFVLVSFASFRFPDSPPKATADYIERFLLTGMSLNNQKYMFYGHSNSQLKSRSCYLYRFKNGLNLELVGKEAFTKLNSFGDFANFSSVAKRAKRIGLLFSTAESSIILQPERTKDIEDIELDGHCFSDGCGHLSTTFATHLAVTRRIIFHENRYIPSAFQIRYQGYKGMLMRKLNMDPGIHAEFRSSMKKFKGCVNNTFSVLDYSKPFTYGYLNGEHVTLLSALGIRNDIFLKKQKEYFQFLKMAPLIPQLAFHYLCYKGQADVAEKILVGGLTRDLQQKVKKLVKEEWAGSFKKKNDGSEEEKVRILIFDSRILFGVCDYTETALKEGECHVRIMTETGDFKTLEGAEVIVTRNPCLHPGDIRKFRAVRPLTVGDKDGPLDHLKDCIVFPTVGSRDPASLMSGGDLDGDKFFVCWDSDLIPNKLQEPYGYPPARETIRRGITYEDTIKYFAQFNNTSLGKVKNLYLSWARVRPNGAASAECQELNKLFSGCVDGERIKIPDHLQDPPPPAANSSPFILDVLCEEVKKAAVKNFELDFENFEATSREVMESILCMADRLSLIDEYELFNILIRWVRQNVQDRLPDLEEFLFYFDFGSFTAVQKLQVLECLKTFSTDLYTTYNNHIWNGLNSSNLLHEKQLQATKLDNSKHHWQRLYASEMDNGARLYRSLERAMESFQEKFIVFSVDSELTVAMYIPQKIEKGEIIDVGSGAVKLFAFGPRSGYFNKQITTPGYLVSYDGEIIQLYDKRRPNSFIWFALNQKWMVRNGIQNQADGPEYFKVSIALQKFDNTLANRHHKVKKQPGAEIEIYVISKRERVGYQILDINDRQVDTTEILRNLENTPRDYALRTDAQTKLVFEFSPLMKRILVNEDYETLRELSPNQLQDVVEQCIQLGNQDKFCNLLKQPKIFQNVPFVSILRGLYTFTGAATLIVPALVANEFTFLQGSLIDIEHSFVFLKMLIISCNDYKDGALLQVERFLFWMELHGIEIDLTNLIDLIKRVIFTVRHVNIAQELIQVILNQPKILKEETAEVVAYVRNFLLAISMNYLGEVAVNCPCDHRGLPAGAEDWQRIMQTSEGKENSFANIATTRLPRSQITYTLSDFIENSRKFLNQNALELNSNAVAPKPHQICLDFKPTSDGLYETMLRSDTRSTLRNEDHIRLAATKRALDSPCQKITVVDAVIQSIQGRKMTCYILQPEPAELVTANWNLYYCSSTTNMINQLSALHKLIHRNVQGTIGYHDILELNDTHPMPRMSPDLESLPVRNGVSLEVHLNASQAAAVQSSLVKPVSLIWGPPGTGKTTVVVEIIRQFLARHPALRILVTGSTHNAVDNVLEKFLKIREKTGDKESEDVVRLASDLGRVNNKLKKWTLDAFVGANLLADDKAKKAALKKLQSARIVFATCDGAGVGLLHEYPSDTGPLHVGLQMSKSKQKNAKRTEKFDVVIVDEASQLTEASTLVPLVKSSRRVILVGDHVQLCPSVTELGKEHKFNVSLFEKLYRSDTTQAGKVMLNEQYRMHPMLSAFPSARFYNGELKDGVIATDRFIRPSAFPWPIAEDETRIPLVFIHCAGMESRFTVSPKNDSQIKMVEKVVKLLQTIPPSDSKTEGAKTGFEPMKIAVLTPYKSQKEEISKLVKTAEVNTIDGFQGREAEIIVFSTVRANWNQNLGFFEDPQRVNVALTRASHGLIIIGHEPTLKGGDICKAMLDACVKVEV